MGNGKKINLLTDVAIRKAHQPGAKLGDGASLYVHIHPKSGGKYWRWDYRFAGKQKTLPLGVYPMVGLKAARAERDKARAMLDSGIDPALARKLEKETRAKADANSFDAIVAELLEKKKAEGKSANTVGKVEWLLGLAKPYIGRRPVSEITAPEVLTVLKAVEARGRLETANRLRATIGQVFRYAVATGRAMSDPTGALRGAIATPVTTHRAAIIEPKAFGGLLRSVAAYEGTPEVKAALEFLALTFVRPGELRAAEWKEIDLDAGLWTIPAERMKMRRPHRVPLAPQAIAILNGLREITAGGKYLFPSVRTLDRCISENTLNAALRRMGYASEDMSAHGFRAAASSQLNESGLWHSDAIERQLAHADSDKVRAAYARGDFWAERVRMMTWWADRCDELRRGGEVVKFKSGAA